MNIKPYTGKFFVLSVLSPNGSVPVAVGTDQVEMLALATELASKYKGRLRGFVLASEGDQLELLDQAMKEVEADEVRRARGFN